MSKLSPIYNIQSKKYKVPVLIGAEEELVRRRELRVKYETNRDIKLWSAWFLLKTISPNSSHIAHWIKHRDLILPFLKCNENTFRRHLKEMIRLGLATVDASYNITLTSYKEAANILGIAHSGQKIVTYNPTKYDGKQSFRFLLVAQEMKHRQELQLNALMYNLDKNPTLKVDIMLMLHKHGADEGLLVTNARYFQERLLQLQLQLFRQGSNILSYVYSYRADINRGVKAIQKHHTYKSASSVSYLKKCMVALGVITVHKKPAVISDERSRLYIPKPGGGQRDGYKWLQKAQKTALFITDQITFNHEKNYPERTATAEKRA